MDWDHLLNTDRLRSEPGKHADIPRNPFAMDQDRIVFSQPFRRLQAKTQVHPLVENDHVRTRLTHSIEVASVGQALGSLIGEVVTKRRTIRLPGEKSRTATRDDFGLVVQAACLAHDIGNPPLGHAGEEAFRDWYRGHDAKAVIANVRGKAERSDLQTFEGNAQGFRILTQIENEKWDGGLRLTYATLATFIKYPWGSTHKLAKPKGKFGYFAAEKEYMSEVAKAVGLVPLRNGAWSRHPLSYLLEAADDICYTIVDMEDAIAMGTLSPVEYIDSLTRFLDEKHAGKYKSLKDTVQRISFLRAEAMTKLVEQVRDVFVDSETAILNGKFQGDLLKQIKDISFINEAKETGRNRIYKHERKIFAELSGYEIIGGLLRDFARSVVGWKDIFRDQRLRDLLGEICPMKSASDYEKLMRVNDFVSGMTDRYALGFYRSE